MPRGVDAHPDNAPLAPHPTKHTKKGVQLGLGSEEIAAARRVSANPGGLHR